MASLSCSAGVATAGAGWKKVSFSYVRIETLTNIKGLRKGPRVLYSASTLFKRFNRVRVKGLPYKIVTPDSPVTEF
jgi:hypothetical protein